MAQAASPGSGSPQKLLATPRAKVRLALVSAVVIGAGALMAPRARQSPLPAPEERAAPLLEEQVQTRVTPAPFRGVQELAGRVRVHGVAILPVRYRELQTHSDFFVAAREPRAGGFGVFVSDSYVLTHVLALDGRSSVELVTADDRTMPASVAAFEPSTGLVLLETQPAGTAAPPQAARPPAAGTLAVAVGRMGGRDVVVPVFIAGADADGYTVTGHGTVRAGMPVFTMDGELFAIAGEQGEAAFAVPEATGRLIARASSGERWAAAGVTLQALDGVLTRVLGESGVLVSAVVDGGPADDAGLAAGDVLVAVGDAEVTSTDHAARALRSATPGVPTRVRFLRAGRPRSLELVTVTAYELAALANASVPAPSHPEGRVLFSASQLAAAGIPPSARIVSVNGRTGLSRAQVQLLLRTARRPVLVLLRHGDTQFFIGLEPAR